MHYAQFKKLLLQSQVLRMPKSNIATFDKTTFRYVHFSPYQTSQTRVREGSLLVHKPLIMLPEHLEHTVSGFDRKVSDFADKMLEGYQKNMKALGYRFINTCEKNYTKPQPIEITLMECLIDLHEPKEATLMVGSETFWEISLLKFLFKIIERSFKVNFQELEERGFLDQRGVPPHVYQDIERLFEKAKGDKKRIKELGALLLEKELFEDYEERFFALMKS